MDRYPGDRVDGVAHQHAEFMIYVPERKIVKAEDKLEVLCGKRGKSSR